MPLSEFRCPESDRAMVKNLEAWLRRSCYPSFAERLGIHYLKTVKQFQPELGQNPRVAGSHHALGEGDCRMLSSYQTVIKIIIQYNDF